MQCIIVIYNKVKCMIIIYIQVQCKYMLSARYNSGLCLVLNQFYCLLSLINQAMSFNNVFYMIYNIVEAIALRIVYKLLW